ncbi:UNVERIFIED_CONTAM: hypothetical protein RMT77_000807 [Armadillidium vulgare]
MVAHPCNPATRKLEPGMVCGGESCCVSSHVEWASALSSSSIWLPLGSLGQPGCSKEV